YRKVHQPLGENLYYSAGSDLLAFDSPVGRMGLMIDYDKTFPEAARTLALDGAALVACLSAWPASVTDRASRMTQDRQSRLFDLYDSARAAENQVIWVSSNQTGVMGGLRFLGQAKVVGPGGDVLARTWSKGGLAVAVVDVEHEVARSRRVLHHLEELSPDAYVVRPPAAPTQEGVPA
ncbi:MAG: carbon-nitrogen hydrolase family protein, partial [Actinomycetales bacterium]